MVVNRKPRKKAKGGWNNTPQNRNHRRKDAQKLLIDAIIERFNSLADAAEWAGKVLGVADFSKQNFMNWRLRSRVPAKHVFRLAEDLRISPYALDFVGLSKMLGSDVSWRDAVKSCEKVLTPETIKEILSLEPPRPTKERRPSRIA